MLEAARRAPSLLHEAVDRVADFLSGQLNADGSAKDRAGRSDLYYTVFVIEGLSALGIDPPVERVRRYLRSFDDGRGLDLVHQTCLARCWAASAGGPPDAALANRLLRNIESYRAADGGYNPTPGGLRGTAYHCMLALGAYQDLGQPLPDPDGLLHCLAELRVGDGGYANEPGLQFGNTPATAAAVALLLQLNETVPHEIVDWLMAQVHQRGGFLVTPQAPFPDLLSTATALHVLGGMEVSLDPIREACLDFVDTLWTGQAFCGHWADDVADGEYTFYGLLALGNLSA